MTSLPSLKKALLARLEANLGLRGFRLSKQDFRRPTPWGWQGVHLSFILHPGIDYDVTVDFGVRHNQLEDMVFEPHPLIPESEKELSASIGAELGNFTQGLPRRWNVSNEYHVEPVARSILKALDDVVFPYFDRFSSLEAIFEIVSRDDREAEKNTSLPDKRAKLALASAYLMRDRNVFDQLVQAKTEFLERKKWRAELKKVREFADQLLRDWPTEA